MTTIIKHSYLKNAAGYRRALSHINYIQHRSGDDRANGARLFFTKEGDSIAGSILKNRIAAQNRRGVIIHKLVVSPGLKSANLTAFVTEIMERLAQSKGQNLEWYAVEHRNTLNPHAHVVIMGTARDTSKVTLYLQETRDLRQWGDKYLEREHIREQCLYKERQRLDRSGMRDRSDQAVSSRADRSDAPNVFPKFIHREPDFSHLDSLLDGMLRDVNEHVRLVKPAKQQQSARRADRTKPVPAKEKEPERER